MVSPMSYYGDLTAVHFSLPDAIERYDYSGYNAYIKAMKADFFQFGHIVKTPKYSDYVYFQGRRMFTVRLDRPLTDEVEMYMRMKYDWIDRAEILRFLATSDNGLY